MKETKKPFFAAFLEKQVQEPNQINGGAGTTTSRLLDSPGGGTTGKYGDHVTMKYPSDSDEGVVI